MPENEPINKWPDEHNEPRNQCKVDHCKFPRMPHSPWCYQHGQEKWSARVAEMADEFEASLNRTDFDPETARRFDAQNGRVS